MIQAYGMDTPIDSCVLFDSAAGYTETFTEEALWLRQLLLDINIRGLEYSGQARKHRRKDRTNESF